MLGTFRAEGDLTGRPLASVLLSGTGNGRLSPGSTISCTISPILGDLPQGNFASESLADAYADTLLPETTEAGLKSIAVFGRLSNKHATVSGCYKYAPGLRHIVELII